MRNTNRDPDIDPGIKHFLNCTVALFELALERIDEPIITSTADVLDHVYLDQVGAFRPGLTWKHMEGWK